jgi:hypothetical protein
MNVDIGTEAAQFPEKEYINGIFVAVRSRISQAWAPLTFTSIIVRQNSVVTTYPG